MCPDLSTVQLEHVLLMYASQAENADKVASRVVFVCMRVCMYVSAFVYVCVSLCVHTYSYVRVSAHVCVSRCDLRATYPC